MTLLQDQQWYGKGEYAAIAVPWGQGPAVLGIDAADTVQVDEQAFPNNTIFRSHWPLSLHNYGQPRGYNAISWGLHEGGTKYVMPPVRRVGEIKTARSEVNTTLTLVSGGCNVLNDCFLLADPKDPGSKMAEYGVFHHADWTAVRHASQGRELGIYNDRYKHAWRVSLNDKYIMVMAADGGDALKCSVDIKEMLDWLRAKDVVKPEWWFTGCALGVEPINGASQVAVNRWAMVVK